MSSQTLSQKDMAPLIVQDPRPVYCVSINMHKLNFLSSISITMPYPIPYLVLLWIFLTHIQFLALVCPTPNPVSCVCIYMPDPYTACHSISVHEITAGHRSLSGTNSCVTDRIRFLPVTLTGRFSNFNSILYTEDRHEL